MPETNTVTPLLNYPGCCLFEPKAALIVFRKQGGFSDCFMELRNIKKDGSMGAAKPVSKQFIQELLSGFSIEYRNTPHGQVPENLLYCDTRHGHERYVWYNPPCRRNRFFNGKLGLKDGIYHVPGTLYVVKDGRLSVFCFEGKKPAPKKPLLGVPYFHVYSDGSVCMGNAQPKFPEGSITYQDILTAWEDAFWNSIDVHTNGSPSTKENLIETIMKYKDKPFDTGELERRPDELTLERLISNIQ